MSLWQWIFLIDAVLVVVLILMVCTGWATDDDRVYRRMKDEQAQE